MPFEGVLAREGLRPRLRRQATLTISVAVHAALVVVGIAYSLWHVEELSPPPMTVTLHLGALPPPPPPPPPLKKRSSTKPTTKTREKADLLVQPKEPSKEEHPKEEADEDEGQDEGVAGGVAGGVTGGVVGGVIGGAAPPPPPKETGPKELLQLPRDLLLIDPNDDEYRVKLPRGLDRSGMKFTARLRICVSAQGTVTEVRVLKGADPAIDPQFPSVLGRWRYRPFTVDGRAVPFCYPIQYEVSAR